MTVSPTDAAPGRYFVAARIQDGGQDHEDVVAVDVGPGSMTRPPADTSSRSPSHWWRPSNGARDLGIEGDRPTFREDHADLQLEEQVEVLDPVIAVAPGGRARLRLSRSETASPARSAAKRRSSARTTPGVTSTRGPRVSRSPSEGRRRSVHRRAARGYPGRLVVGAHQDHVFRPGALHGVDPGPGPPLGRTVTDPIRLACWLGRSTPTGRPCCRSGGASRSSATTRSGHDPVSDPGRRARPELKAI